MTEVRWAFVIWGLIFLSGSIGALAGALIWPGLTHAVSLCSFALGAYIIHSFQKE